METHKGLNTTATKIVLPKTFHSKAWRKPAEITQNSTAYSLDNYYMQTYTAL